MLKIGCTYDFLLRYEPFVNLVHVEEVIAGQNPNAVTLGEHLEADGTLVLFVHPGRFD